MKTTNSFWNSKVVNGGHLSVARNFMLLIFSSKTSINCLNYSSLSNNNIERSERHINGASNFFWSDVFLFFSIIDMFYVYHVFHSTNISLKHITCFVSMECLITMECFKSMECFNKVFLIHGVFHINEAYHKFHINGAYHHITCFSFLIFYIHGANNGLWSDVFLFFKIALNQKLDSAYLSDGFLY